MTTPHDLPPVPLEWSVRDQRGLVMMHKDELHAYALAALAPYKAEIERLLAERAGIIANEPGHPSWKTASRESLVDALWFQGAMTRALLPEQERAVKAEAEVAKLRELLAGCVDGREQCWYDHHGYCQAHNLQPKGECWVELARAALGEKK